MGRVRGARRRRPNPNSASTQEARKRVILQLTHIGAKAQSRKGCAERSTPSACLGGSAEACMAKLALTPQCRLSEIGPGRQIQSQDDDEMKVFRVVE